MPGASDRASSAPLRRAPVHPEGGQISRLALFPQSTSAHSHNWLNCSHTRDSDTSRTRRDCSHTRNLPSQHGQPLPLVPSCGDFPHSHLQLCGIDIVALFVRYILRNTIIHNTPIHMTKTASIGIDLGHSSVKISVKSGAKSPLVGAAEIFPTVVRNWIPITNEETARKAQVDTVEVNGKKFFVGVTAQRQGQADSFSGQTRNWIETEQHDALLVSAWERANRILGKNELEHPEHVALVLGLPASYYAEQRDTLRSRANALLQPLVKPHQELKIYVESQSRAPLLCVVFDSNGVETGVGGEDETWGVVEIGQFTTDFTLHDRGQEVDSAATSARGAQMVYDRISAALKQKGYVADFETISSAIQTRKIKVFGKEEDVSDIISPALSEFSTYIDEEVATRFGDKAQRMDGIIVAGGGAYIVGQNVKAKYPNAIIPTNPRFAVAEGYSRFGLLTIC